MARKVSPEIVGELDRAITRAEFNFRTMSSRIDKVETDTYQMTQMMLALLKTTNHVLDVLNEITGGDDDSIHS